MSGMTESAAGKFPGTFHLQRTSVPFGEEGTFFVGSSSGFLLGVCGTAKSVVDELTGGPAVSECRVKDVGSPGQVALFRLVLGI